MAVYVPNEANEDRSYLDRLKRIRENLRQLYLSQSQLRYLDNISWYHPLMVFCEAFPDRAIFQPFDTVGTLSVLEWKIDTELAETVPNRDFSFSVRPKRAWNNVYQYVGAYGVCGLFAGLSYWVVGKTAEKYGGLMIGNALGLPRRSLTSQMLSAAGGYLAGYPFRVMAVETLLELTTVALRTRSIKQTIKLPIQDIIPRYYYGLSVNALMSSLSFAFNSGILWLESQLMNTPLQDDKIIKGALYFTIIFVDIQLFVVARRFMVRQILDNTPMDHNNQRAEESSLFDDFLDKMTTTLPPFLDFYEDILSVYSWFEDYFNRPL